MTPVAWVASDVVGLAAFAASVVGQAAFAASVVGQAAFAASVVDRAAFAASVVDRAAFAASVAGQAASVVVDPAVQTAVGHLDTASYLAVGILHCAKNPNHCFSYPFA